MATSPTNQWLNILSTAYPLVLNYGGALLVATGVFLLPIDISYRLIILGIFALATWHASK